MSAKVGMKVRAVDVERGDEIRIAGMWFVVDRVETRSFDGRDVFTVEISISRDDSQTRVIYHKYQLVQTAR